MMWELDLDADSMYVRLSSEAVARQEQLPSGIIVDLDAAGALRGVEILRASVGWDPSEVIARFPMSLPDVDSLRYLSKAPPLVKPTAIDADAETMENRHSVPVSPAPDMRAGSPEASRQLIGALLAAAR